MATAFARIDPRVIVTDPLEWSQLLNGVAGTATESAKPGRYGERNLAPAPAMAGVTNYAQDAGDFVKDSQYPTPLYPALSPVNQAAQLGKAIVDSVHARRPMRIRRWTMPKWAVWGSIIMASRFG